MKNDTKKVLIRATSLFVGSLAVYVSCELIKEYNKTLKENDRLREYIATKLIKNNQDCNIVLSNGKRFTNNRIVEKSVVPQIIKTYEENEQEITEFDNGWKMIRYKGGA